jgi:hypothetical protein
MADLIIQESDHLHASDALTIGTTWETDFSEYATSAALSDWTERWTTANTSNTVYAASWQYALGKRLDIVNTAAQRSLLTWDDLGSPADVDILALGKGSNFNAEGYRIHARCSGSAGAENSYYVSVNATDLLIARYVSGVASIIASATFQCFDDSCYWIRFRINGTTLQAKIWSYFSEEPVAWALETTDSSHASGWAGVGLYAINTASFYYFGCGLNGAAPKPPTAYTATNSFGLVYPITPSFVGINSCIAMGGQVGAGGITIYGARIYVGSTHSAQVRVAAYTGGDLASGPDGADLLFDFGLTSGSAQNVFLTFYCPPTFIAEGTTIWLAIKSNDGYFAAAYTTKVANRGSYQVANGRYISTVVSTDETVAYPDPWPSDGGSFSTSAYFFDLRTAPYSFDLTVADADHLHDGEGIELVQRAVLTVADADHLHTAANVALTQLHDLLAAGADHLQVTDGIDLTQTHILAIAAGDHLHVAAAPPLTQIHNLAIAEAAHLHVADNVAPVQIHILTAAEANHDLVSANLVLGTSGILGVASAAHLQVADALPLIQLHDLSVAGADHLQVADGLTLSQGHHLTVASADHLHIGDGITVTQQHTLAAAGADHLQLAGTADLVQIYALTVAETYHAHAGPNLVLTPTLTVAGADHLQSADNITVTTQGTLAVASADHLHVSDPISLTQAHTLTVAAADHLCWSSVVAATQRHALVVSDTFHLHDAAMPMLAVGLSCAAGAHELVSDSIELVTGFDLVVAAADHDMVADAPVLTVAPAVQPAAHVQAADTLALSGTHNLSVAGAAHYHEGEKPDIVMVGTLPVQSSVIATTADTLALSGTHNLLVAAGHHLTSADAALAITQAHYLDMDAGYGHSYHLHVADSLRFAALPEIERPPLLVSLTVQRSYRSRSVFHTIERRAA